jgi:hypothetical protein
VAVNQQWAGTCKEQNKNAFHLKNKAGKFCNGQGRSHHSIMITTAGIHDVSRH